MLDVHAFVIATFAGIVKAVASREGAKLAKKIKKVSDVGCSCICDRHFCMNRESCCIMRRRKAQGVQR